MNFLQKWAERVTPEPFREFVPYVSPSSIYVVHADEVLGKALKIAGHYFAIRKSEEISAALAEALSLESILIQSTLPPRLNNLKTISTFSAREKKKIGNRLLALYFILTHAEGAFLYLDLSLDYLFWDEKKGNLIYVPRPLGFHPSVEFTAGVKSLYRGFYEEDPGATALGVGLYAWKSKPVPGFEKRIEGLLRDHFGAAQNAEISFSIAHFRESFHSIFEEAKKSRAKFHPELTFVGVMLVTLYRSLEALGQSYPVKEIYQRVVNKK